MKKTLSLLLILLLLFSLALPTLAAEAEPEFRFSLSANGKTVVEVEPGDLVTVSLSLERTDDDDPFTMYGMQDELRYDGSFLELIDDTLLIAPGVETTDISVRGAFRELYMNYVSLTGGDQWNSRTTVGSVQFRVIGTQGISRITNMDAKVSGADGLFSLPCLWQDVSIVIAGDCLVHFESNGGTLYTDRIVRCGQLLTPPQEPQRRGYSFSGWFRDAEITEAWDFENDMVEKDMTLYAGWNRDEGGFGWNRWLLIVPLLLFLLLFVLLLLRHKVHFDASDVAEIKDMIVFGQSLIDKPVIPTVPGKVFIGWYRDEARTQPWNFKEDKVTKNMTLYAKWQ